MKLSVSSLLRGGVFMLASVFAFAFTQPKSNSMIEYGSEDEVTWYIIDDNATLGVDYQCNSTQEQIHCLYDAPDASSGTPIGLIQRQFVLLNPNLEEAE